MIPLITARMETLAANSPEDSGDAALFPMLSAVLIMSIAARLDTNVPLELVNAQKEMR